MSSESGERGKRRNGPLIGAAEEIATGVGRMSYGLFSLGLGLLPQKSRRHMDNALRELHRAIIPLPGTAVDIVRREIDRWDANEPARPRVTHVKLDTETISIETEAASTAEVSTVTTLGAAAAESPALVSIVHIEFDPPGRDIDGEYVLIRNDGAAPADMSGWALHDGDSKHTYTFPAFTLAPGAEVKLWSRAGVDDAANLYWGSRMAIWNNTGDTATLNNAGGAKMAGYSYEAKTK